MCLGGGDGLLGVWDSWCWCLKRCWRLDEPSGAQNTRAGLWLWGCAGCLGNGCAETRVGHSTQGWRCAERTYKYGLHGASAAWCLSTCMLGLHVDCGTGKPC